MPRRRREGRGPKPDRSRVRRWMCRCRYRWPRMPRKAKLLRGILHLGASKLWSLCPPLRDFGDMAPLLVWREFLPYDMGSGLSVPKNWANSSISFLLSSSIHSIGEDFIPPNYQQQKVFTKINNNLTFFMQINFQCTSFPIEKRKQRAFATKNKLIWEL